MLRFTLSLAAIALLISSSRALAADSKPVVPDQIDASVEFVEKAEKAFAQKDFAEAERCWRIVVDKHPTSKNFGVAQYNLGYVLQEQGHHDGAIAEYLKLLPSKVNDKEPGANIMEVYRNYRNKAAKQISACYEKKGLPGLALDWAIQARDKYPYYTWCGTCAMQEKKATDSNIGRLQRLVDAAPKR